MPRFRNPNTGEIIEVSLPKKVPTWTTGENAMFPGPIPSPACSGFVPPPANNALPDPTYPGYDIFDDETDLDYSELDPDVDYEVLHQTYSTDTYFNIPLKKSDFPNVGKVLFLKVETMPG